MRKLFILLFVLLTISGCRGNKVSADSHQASKPTSSVQHISQKSQTTSTGITSPTPLPSTDSPSSVAVVANSNSNLRGGPGTNFEIVGGVAAGTTLHPVEFNDAGDWLRLVTGEWIAAFLVDGDLSSLSNTESASGPTQTPPDHSIVGTPAQLTKVVDGDTIDVIINGQPDTIRYIGIDTPERGQPGYKAATEANRALLGDGDLILVADHTNRDKYGRLLRYVYRADGTFVDSQMVAQGWAQPVEYPPDMLHAEEFKSAAVDAAKRYLGFWSGTSDHDGAMSYGLTLATATVYKDPYSEAQSKGTLPIDTPLTIFGRTGSGDWLQIRPPSRDGGWIRAHQVDVNVPIEQIMITYTGPTSTPTPNASTSTPAPSSDTPTPTQVVVDSPPPAEVVISYIYYDGQVSRVESDEYAVIKNTGVQSVNLSGWRLNADDEGQDFWFPSLDLQPGQEIRVYTNQVHPESGGYSFGSAGAIWRNKGECGHLYDATGAEVSNYCF